MGDSVFGYCDNLSSVIIGESVTSIGKEAFYNCDNLSSVVIGNSVSSIGDEAFYDCDKLRGITIPDSVTSIGDFAFRNCDNLWSIVIGNSVTSIGNGAFVETEYYKDESNWIDGVLYLGNYLIHTNQYLPSLCVIKDGTVTIADYAFYVFGWEISVVIPSSVKYIGENAFLSCEKLDSVYITDIAKWCNIEFGNSYANPLSFAESFYLNNELATDIVIPDGVEFIGDYAFLDYERLTSVVIPDSVEFIGDMAFFDCDNLTRVVIPDSIISIGERAFEDCGRLRSVVISSSVEFISPNAFYGCSSLTDVYYTGSEEEWNSINISNWNDYLLGVTIHFNYVPEE